MVALLPALFLLLHPVVTPTPAWPEEMRASAEAQCLDQLPGAARLCACLTRELERLSPDPDEPFAPGDFSKAMKVCRPPAAKGIAL